MSNSSSRSLSNNFQDVRLVSLASWSKAAEIQPRDPRGPYVVIQEGYDPADFAMNPDEFILGRSGKWLSIAFFYRLPVAERRQEYVFGTAAEVMRVLGNLTSKVAVYKPGESLLAAEPKDAAVDELVEAIRGQGGKDTGRAPTGKGGAA